MKALKVNKIQSRIAFVLYLILIPLCQSCASSNGPEFVIATPPDTSFKPICPQNISYDDLSSSRQVKVVLKEARLFDEYELTANAQVLVAYALCNQIETSADTWNSKVVETSPGEDIRLDFPISIESVPTITSAEPLLIYILIVDRQDLAPFADKTWDIAAELLAEIASKPFGFAKGFILEQLINGLSDRAKAWYESQEVLAEILIRVPVMGDPEVVHNEMGHAVLSYAVQFLSSTPTSTLSPVTPTAIVTPTMPSPLEISYTYDPICLTDGSSKWSITIYIEASGGTPPFTYFMHGDHEEQESDQRKFNYEWEGNTGGNFVHTLEVRSLDGQKASEEIYIENMCDRNG